MSGTTDGLGGQPADTGGAAEPGTVGLLLVATGRYRDFLPSVVAGAQRHVAGLTRVYVFSDADPRPDLGRTVTWLPWGHLPWPYPTLLRYRAFSAYADMLGDTDVLLYSDVDMRFQDDVDVRAAAGTIAVIHPGYDGVPADKLPYERREESVAYIPRGAGERYVAGGVQGGRTAAYVDACRTITQWALTDLANGIVPVWHDESLWNKYCHLFPPSLILPRRYCVPEYENDPDAAIVALDKDHDALRGTRSASRRMRRVRSAVGRGRRVLRPRERTR